MGHCLDLGDTALALPPVLRDARPARRRAPRRRRRPSPATTRPSPGCSPAAACSPPRAATRAVGSTAPTCSTAVHALLEEAAPATPRSLARRRGLPLGRPARPATCSASSSPVDFTGPVVAGRQLPRRRPPPAPPAPQPGRRVVPAARRTPAARAVGPLADDAVRQLIAELAPTGSPWPRPSTSSTAPRATRSSSRSSPAPPPGPAAGSRPTWPTCCWSGSTGSATPPGQVVRAASVAGRKVSHELLAAASGLSDPRALDEGLRQAVEMNVLVAQRRPLRLPPRAARRGGLRRPAARRAGPAPRAVRRGAARRSDVAGTAAELARHARLAHDLDTAVLASIRAGHDALAVGGPDEARPPLRAGARAGHRPAPAARDSTSTASALVVAPRRCADRLRPSPRGRRPARRGARRGCPPTRPRAWRARMLSRAGLPAADHRDRGRARSRSPPRPSGSSPTARPAVRARVLAPTPASSPATADSTRRSRSALEALALAERLQTSPSWSPTSCVTLSQARHTGPQGRAARGAGRGDRPRSRGPGAVDAELRGHFLLGRSYEDHGRVAEAERRPTGARSSAPTRPGCRSPRTPSSPAGTSSSSSSSAAAGTTPSTWPPSPGRRR